MTLTGQRVLLIGIGFYDYEQAIKDELCALGADVVHFSEEPPAPSVLQRKFGLGEDVRLRAHHETILKKIVALPKLDHILVIKGRTLKPDFLQSVRSAHADAQFIAYHWDSVQRSPEQLELAPLFDRVLTFDHRDATALPGFIHRPLFFRPELAYRAKKDRMIDISFVGWLHHDRLSQIDAMYAAANARGLKFSVHLSTGRYTALRHGWLARRNFVYAWPMKFGDYAKLVHASKAVLDLPHPRQSGMTMRCIEVVPGAHCKLITTNPDCAGYDFYDAANVHVLGKNHSELPEGFLREPGRPIPDEISERYSIRSWVLDVFHPERLMNSLPFFVDPS